jgi:uncharacterized protein with PIN domain
VNPVFIADVHLGKLARMLRLLGFDTLYSNVFTPPQLRALANEHDRVLLSRSSSFVAELTVHSVVIRSEEPEMQLQQVVQQFGLQHAVRPFSRCLVCNGLLLTVPKEHIVSLLEKNTSAFFDKFWQCTACLRIYWKGSHYYRMLALVERVKHVAL